MRYLTPYIEADLKKKMVFLGGPRQCGKTTLAKMLLKKLPGKYLNWDSREDQRLILSEGWTADERLIVLDEIHKHPKWKNMVKGMYDTTKEEHDFLVTGSARLDVYRRGGDSLLGRYHYWRLHPFTLDELPAGIDPAEGFERLLKVGGFPEPFLDNDVRESRRWREERYDRIIRDDIRDLENFKNVQQMDLLLQLLRERVGGMINVANLARDVQVSAVTVARWIEIFEKMYVVFRVTPYAKKLPRALVKPFKIYFFDNADVIGDEGVKLENLVATHLLKRTQFLQDFRGEKWNLHYLRDKEHREVDFVILRDGVIQEMIEVKWQETAPSKALTYFGEKLKAPKLTQLVGRGTNNYRQGAFQLQSVLSYFKRPVW